MKNKPSGGAGGVRAGGYRVVQNLYKAEAVGLKKFKYTFKTTFFVNMWNLGQFR